MDDSYREKCPDVTGASFKKLRKLFSFKSCKKFFPIIEWLPRYRKSFVLHDLIAGLTVALTVIPQAIADAAIAGLPPQYGLYSSFMGCFVYVLFGSCKDITIGPTAIMSLLIQTVVMKLNVEFAILTTFLSGLAIFVLGLMNIGFLMEFISSPTIAAFIFSATIIIISGQMKSLLGIKSGTARDFIGSWQNVFTHLHEIRPTDATLGIASIVILVILRKLGRTNKDSTFFKYLSISRNALVVFGGSMLAFLLYMNNSEPFRLTGDIKAGFPPIQLPPFTAEFNNQTYNFPQMAEAIGLSLITIPLISVLESIAIAKAFSQGKVLDATQEMIALGMCNIISGFFSSIPVTGSFTRTALNNASGVKSQFGGIFTGCIVLLSIGLLTSTFFFIPKATLAAIIIVAMFTMMGLDEIKIIFRTKKFDMIPFVATTIASLLLGIEYGILVGIGISLVFTLYQSSRPKIIFFDEKFDDCQILLLKPEQSLIYSSAEYFQSFALKKATINFPNTNWVVINGEQISYVDSTVVKKLSSIVMDMKACGKKVIFWNWQNEPFHAMMRFNRKNRDLFMSAVSLKDLIQQIKINDNIIQVSIVE